MRWRLAQRIAVDPAHVRRFLVVTSAGPLFFDDSAEVLSCFLGLLRDPDVRFQVAFDLAAEERRLRLSFDPEFTPAWAQLKGVGDVRLAARTRPRLVHDLQRRGYEVLDYASPARRFALVLGGPDGVAHIKPCRTVGWIRARLWDDVPSSFSFIEAHDLGDAARPRTDIAVRFIANTDDGDGTLSLGE